MIFRILILIGLLSVASLGAADEVWGQDGAAGPESGPSGTKGLSVEPLPEWIPVAADVASRVDEARTSLLHLNLDRAEMLLAVDSVSADEEGLIRMTAALSRLVVLLLDDGESEFDDFLAENSSLESFLESLPGTAWRHWLLGEVASQRAWARSKRGESIRAALALRRAMKHLERSRELDPRLVEPLMGLGLIHLGISALPDRHRRFLRWFGYGATLDEGLSELDQARREARWNDTEAAVILATVDKYGFPSPVQAQAEYRRLWNEHPGSPLIGFLLADALIRDRQPAEALAVLEQVDDPSGRAHYLTWFRGEALVNLGRCREAVAAFEAYEDMHAGPSLKSAGRMMAGRCLEEIGDRETALTWYARVLDDRGFAEEQAAIREATNRMANPMTEAERRALRARAQFNAAQDSASWEGYASLLEAPATPGAVRAEAAYYLARIHHVAADTLAAGGRPPPHGHPVGSGQGSVAEREAAMAGYRAVLLEAADPMDKWHGFARMHLAALLIQSGQQAEAREVINALEAMDAEYDFRSSVENRVRFLEWAPE